MGELHRRYRKSLGKPCIAAFAAAVMLLAVSSCGVIAEQAAGGQSTGTGRTTAASVPPSASASAVPTPTPEPTPGKGPACPAVRCTSVLVTGDMLVHAQLWDQARASFNVPPQIVAASKNVGYQACTTAPDPTGLRRSRRAS